MNKQLITLSDNAADRIKEIIAGSPESTIGVRVGVKSGGCAGMSYVMEYTKNVDTNDEIIEDIDFAVNLEPKECMEVKEGKGLQLLQG